MISSRSLFWTIAGLIALGSSGGLASRYKAHLAASEIEQKADADRVVELAQASAQEDRSAIALERVRAGCVPVLVGDKEQHFTVGTPVVVAQGSVSPFRIGAAICNSLRDTAVVELMGGKAVIADIASASPEDYQEFDKNWAVITGQPVPAN